MLLDRQVTAGAIEISLDANDDYLIIYNHEGRDRCHQFVRARRPHTDGTAGLAVYRLDSPACAAVFDRVRILGRHGFGPFFFGHLRLVP